MNKTKLSDYDLADRIPIILGYLVVVVSGLSVLRFGIWLFYK